MANLVSTYAKGRFVEKALLPLGTDNLLIVLFKSSGLPTDTNLRNYQTLAAAISGGAVEADFTNYARKVLTTSDITVSYNTSTFSASVDIADQTWNAAGGAVNNTLGKLLIAYRPTSASPDSAVLPLKWEDYTGSTTGGVLTWQVNAAGIGTAS